MFTAEINKISLITDQAVDCVYKGQFNQAKKLIAKVKNSFCVTESERALTIVESLILLHRQKKSKARELIYLHNHAAWGSQDLKEILLLCNPSVDHNSKIFNIRIKGGYASFGAFTQFSSEHSCDFEVVANSQEEALKYIKELANFAEPENMQILACSSQECPAEYEHRGIIRNSPFYTTDIQDRNNQNLNPD